MKNHLPTEDAQEAATAALVAAVKARCEGDEVCCVVCGAVRPDPVDYWWVKVVPGYPAVRVCDDCMFPPEAEAEKERE